MGQMVYMLCHVLYFSSLGMSIIIMKIQKSFKFRMRVTKQREQEFLELARCSRFVWNKALAIQKEKLDAGERVLSYFDMVKMLTEWRNDPEFPFLKDASAQGMQVPLKALSNSVRSALKKGNGMRFPSFRRQDKESFGYYGPSIKLDGNTVYLPKLGWVNFVKHREIIGKIKNATISRKVGHWYIAIQTEQEVEDPAHPHPDKKVGIHLGSDKFVIFSDGQEIDALTFGRDLEAKIAKEQKKFARMTKGSRRWLRQKAKIGKIHFKIANRRKDFLHKLSAKVTGKHGLVAIEDIDLKQKIKLEKDNVENRKHIIDQSWFEFRRQLEYKESWKGGQVIPVPALDTPDVTINGRQMAANILSAANEV